MRNIMEQVPPQTMHIEEYGNSSSPMPKNQQQRQMMANNFNTIQSPGGAHAQAYMQSPNAPRNFNDHYSRHINSFNCYSHGHLAKLRE